MKVSVISIWRDAGEDIHRRLKLWEDLEKYSSDVEFEYFFYENDSADDTPEILSSWLRDKKGQIKSETLGNPRFGSIQSEERYSQLAYYRNKALNLARPLTSDYCFVWDNDVSFDANILEEYLKFNIDPSWVMLCPNIRQDIPCKMGSGAEDSYYDSLPLVDLKDIRGMTWSDCPFYSEDERKAWANNKPVHVKAAYGGMTFARSKVLEKTRWSWTNSGGSCEISEWCERLNEHGKIYIMPNIKAYVTIEQKTFSHEERVISKQQETLGKTDWERYLLINNQQ